MNLLKLRNLYPALAACGLCVMSAAAQAGTASEHPVEPAGMGKGHGGEFLIAAKDGNTPGYCRSYAKRAIDARKASVRNGCGFTGARWHPNSDTHYNWCLRVSRATAESESRARQRQLQDCKQGSTRGTNEGYCRSYAERAVNTQKTNQRNGCGFTGARWQANFDNHYNWCLGVPRRTAESESRARQRQLQSCK